MKNSLRRRHFLAALLTAPLALRAQERKGVRRIALLSIGTDPNLPMRDRLGRWHAFFDAMRELGSVEGRDFEAKPYFGDGIAAKLPALVTELKRWPPDIIVTTGD